MQLPEEDSNAIAGGLERLGTRSAEAGYDAEAFSAIQGLMELGTSIQQLGPTGVVNHDAQTTTSLAAVERVGEQYGQTDVAVRALAGWLVVTSYGWVHLQLEQNPHWPLGIERFGPYPAWDAAAELIQSDDYARRWINKMPRGTQPVIENLEGARQAHNIVHGY